jgi:hypothetical protein
VDRSLRRVGLCRIRKVSALEGRKPYGAIRSDTAHPRTGPTRREATTEVDVTDEGTEQGRSAGKLGFLDSLGRLFRRREEAAPAAPEGPGRFAALEADFDGALRRLNEKLAEHQRVSVATGATGGPAASVETAEERAAERARRLETCHRAMREDIEKEHARLGTGLSGDDLTALAGYLQELVAVTAPGRQSHALLPRARFAIGERLRSEAGALAVARLVDLLGRARREWPDPTHYRPSAPAEEIERSRRRRLAEIRENFLASDLERTAERMLGIVRGWGADYPDRGTPLWEECALEGVAAGIRAQLVRDFVETLRRDQAALVARVEASVGKEITGLQAVVQAGVQSIEQANQAVASSLRVLDEMVPEVAWQQVRSQLPQARGEWAA